MPLRIVRATVRDMPTTSCYDFLILFLFSPALIVVGLICSRDFNLISFTVF